MDQLINITALLNTMKRFWWLPLVTMVIGAAVAVDFGRRLPKFYRANTLILVEPQKIPANYVKPIVATPIGNRLKTIRQEVTSRSRIEKVIREANLFPDLRERVSTEDLVARVNRGIQLEVRGEDTFRISFQDKDPQVAADVANAVAELFINENIAARTAQAKSTASFLDEQLEKTAAELSGQESRISEFNQKHLGQLPTDRDANFRALENRRSQLQIHLDSIAKAEERRILLEKELNEQPASGVTTLQTATSLLDQMRQQLVELSSEYTEQHPEVAQLKRRIAQFEKELAARNEKKEAEPAEAVPVTASAYEQKLRQDIKDLELSIRDQRKDADRIKAEIGEYDRRLEKAPENEQELLTLTRDYAILKDNYRDLLRKRNEAIMAQSLELQRQGEQFIVLDRAVPPRRPYKPDYMQINAFGSGIGFMSGLVLTFLFDLLRPRFRTEDELLAAYGIPVLVSIPIMGSHAETAFWKRPRVLVGTGILVMAVVAAVAFGLTVWAK